MSSIRLARRRFLALSAAGLGGSLLSGCDRLSETPEFQEFLSSTEELNYRIQRLLGSRGRVFRWRLCCNARPFFPPPASLSSTAPTFLNKRSTVPDNIMKASISSTHPSANHSCAPSQWRAVDR
jgi:hypothetical protein